MRLSCGVYIDTVNVFSSVIILSSLDERRLFEKYFEGWILHGSLLHSILKPRNFYKTCISQGSVATCLRCGGTLRNHSIQQICWRVCQWKNSKNRFRFDEVTAMSSMSSFFGTRCLLYAYMLRMYLLHFAWVVDDAKYIVVMRVCVSVCVSVCLCVCPRPYAHTTAQTRM